MERKVVLITGAAQGIGKAIALAMAKEGYDVVINYIGHDDKALEVAQECRNYGSDAMIVKADVSDYKQVEDMVEEVLKHYSHIDVLVNNAGITRDGLMLRMKEEDFNAVIQVNLNGCFNTIKHVSKIMMKQRQGSIINMASVIGLVGNIGQTNYAASKAGVIGITKSTAKEFASRNIRVNAIAPGFIDTDMTAVLSENVKENILSQIPLHQLGSVEDVANLVLFLAGNQSRYITGQVIHVDGGMVM